MRRKVPQNTIFLQGEQLPSEHTQFPVSSKPAQSGKCGRKGTQVNYTNKKALTFRLADELENLTAIIYAHTHLDESFNYLQLWFDIYGDKMLEAID